MRTRLTRHLRFEPFQAADFGNGEVATDPPRFLAPSARRPGAVEMQALGSPLPAAEAKESIVLDPPRSVHDAAIYLLHIAAEVEHALMVQYLYAAFSLGGTNLSEERRATVERWRRTVLGIAREEMGHLATVQNLLRLIGGPMTFEREDYPFPSDLYPFKFRLEPLSKHSLAKYVLAEMPANLDNAEIVDIKKHAREPGDADFADSTSPVNRVGLIPVYWKKKPDRKLTYLLAVLDPA
jgi:hypothetical protein